MKLYVLWIWRLVLNEEWIKGKVFLDWLIKEVKYLRYAHKFLQSVFLITTITNNPSQKKLVLESPVMGCNGLLCNIYCHTALEVWTWYVIVPGILLQESSLGHISPFGWMHQCRDYRLAVNQHTIKFVDCHNTQYKFTVDWTILFHIYSKNSKMYC